MNNTKTTRANTKTKKKENFRQVVGLRKGKFLFFFAGSTRLPANSLQQRHTGPRDPRGLKCREFQAWHTGEVRLVEEVSNWASSTSAVAASWQSENPIWESFNPALSCA